MDYKQHIGLLLNVFFITSLLSACDTELEPDALKILGEPAGILLYDTDFEFELGASGGDGVYRYRYIQNPDVEDREDDFVFNPVELSIEQTDGPKPAFFLRGVPSVDETEDDTEISSKNLSYQIALSDGRTEIIKTYDFTLKLNNLNVSGSEKTILEGSVSNVFSERLSKQREQEIAATGSSVVCDEAAQVFVKSVDNQGQTIVPAVFDVFLDLVTTTEVKLFYRINSSYKEDLPERDRQNIGHARPGVDYVDQERSFTLKEGQGRCIFYVDILDDAIIEGDETFDIEFYKHEGGSLEISQGHVTIKLADNEPMPVYKTSKVTRNEGDSVTVSLSLLSPYDVPLYINVSIDNENTTAEPGDYELSPESGVITIAPGQTEASYTVSLIINDDDTKSVADDVVSIITDIDTLTEQDAFEITINDWALGSNLNEDPEIIAKEKGDNNSVIAMDIDGNGNVIVLLENSTNPNEELAIVKAYYKDASSLDLIETGAIHIASDGLRIKPKAILVYSRENETKTGDTITIVANVNALMLSNEASNTNIHRGGLDFIVAIFELDTTGFYKALTLKQYGTEGDDKVLGATLDEDGNIYVYGETNGSEFDGRPGLEVNNGKKDGFIYKIEPTANKLDWDFPRFVGGVNDDSVVSVDVGRNDLVMLIKTTNTDVDAVVRKLSTSKGLDIEDLDEAFIASLNDDHAAAVSFDHNNSIFYALMDSKSLLPESEPTPTLSVDVSLLFFSSEIKNSGEILISTQGVDTARDLQLLSRDGRLIVGGKTDGVFENNARVGGEDVFVSSLGLSESQNLTVEKTVQFGTSGDDDLIEIKGVGDRKFLVLWSENKTSLDGTLTYRISAFSSDGTKLSLNPAE